MSLSIFRGSAFALFATLVFLAAGAARSQGTIRDDFSTSSWSESSGTRPWAGAWTGDLGPNAVRDAAGGELEIRQNNTAIQRSANLSGDDVATLSIRVRTIGALEADDRLILQVGSAASGPWTTLETFADDIAGSIDRSYVISAALSSATTVRLLVSGANGSGEAFGIDFVEIRATAPTCFADNFGAATLNASDWATNSVSGSFGQPRIVGGRLRLTDNSGNVSTAATLRRFFPGADNRVVVEFDYLAYNGSGADGVAVTLSDGSVTPVAGGFGGSLGYAQRSGINGFAGGWLGVGIDEFGNFSSATEARVGGPGFRADSVALRGSGSGTTGYPYLDGTTTLSPGVDVAGATPGPNHRYRITVDNRAGVVAGARVSVERDTTGTGNSYATIVPAFNIFTANTAQAPVPANFRLSLTGSTGGSTNIHELDNLRVCATRIDQLVEIDHFRFLHDGQGLTCQPESVVVQACLDPNCTQQVSGPIQVTLSPSGWIGGDTQTITSGQTLQFARRTPGNVAFAVSASTPPRRPFTPDRCFVGGVQQQSCSLAFANAGFVHEVSNHVSAVEQVVTLRAVRLDDQSQRCVPSFANVTRTVGFWQQFLNPTTGTQRIQVTSGSATLPVATAPAGTQFALPFNADGETTIRVRYDDAGSMRLLSRYTGSAATGDAGLVMEGTDDFVAKPRDFLLEVAGSGPGNATTASGPIFARAGAPFTATVTARNNVGAATPNFGREVVPERVRLLSTLQAPGGGNNPDPEPLVAAGFGAFANGTATGQWRWNEVGIITLSPDLSDGDYLGYGRPAQPAPGDQPNVIGAALANVGRFVPARLGVTPNVPTLANACAAGGFGYLGQEFGFTQVPVFEVGGVNALGTTTLNYDVVIAGATNPFRRFAGTLPDRSYANAVTGTAATLSRTTNGGAGVVADRLPAAFDGLGTVTINGDRLTYAKPATPEPPFTAQLTLNLTATDLTDSDGVCFDNALDGCDALAITGIAGASGTPAVQRWGRIALSNAFGTELTDLQVPMRAEFFNGSAFVTNLQDVCSAVTLQPIADANPGDGLLPSETCVQDSGSPGASGQGCGAAGPVALRYTPTPPIANAGSYTLWLRAPGAGNVGILDVTPVVPAWLRFDWRGTGPTAPTARVGFGVFQGDRRAIHEREVY